MHGQHGFRLAAIITILVTLMALVGAFSVRAAEKPETVMVTYHAKPGSETALANAIARQWKLGRSLNLFRAAPHVVVRGIEAKHKTPYFVEILTWRDASIPDAPPPALQAIWREMNSLVESPGGRPGIDIAPVSLMPK